MANNPETALAEAYALEDLKLASWGGKEMLKLELLMDYSEAFSADSPDVHPVAAVRWEILSDSFKNETSVREFKIILAAHLYAKALAVDQLRAELFDHVGNAIRACLKSGDISSLTFPPMFVTGRTTDGVFQNIVWPWKLASWDEVERRRPRSFVQLAEKTSLLRRHTATLLSGPTEPSAPGGSWLRYRADTILTKIFVPAAALIAITDVWRAIPEGHGLMLSLLKNINDYHESPDQITISDVMAMNAALEVVLSTGGRSIAEFRNRDRAANEALRRHDQQMRNANKVVFQAALNWLRRK